MGTRGVLQGRYSRGSLGIPRGFAPGRPTHARISDLRPCRSPSVAARVHAAADAITFMVCMSLGENCVLVDSRARVSADARVCLCAPLGPSVCTARVNELCVRACASRLHAPSHRTAATCGINRSARAARCGRARVVAFGATGRARARRPQVSPGRAARPTRFMGDNRTRPWSTLPAPSTSSAATGGSAKRSSGSSSTTSL